ncbi:MAG: tetratricopeptide repeat protein [Terriglobia bacterium]
MACCALGLTIIFLLSAASPSLHAQNGRQSRAQPASSGDWTYQPPSPEKSVEIGNFYLHREDDRAALSRFKEAIKTDPDYAPAYLGLGKAYEKLGEHGKALASYEKYLQELPSDRAAARAKDAHKAIARLKREIAKSNTRKNTASAVPPPAHQ